MIKVYSRAIDSFLETNRTIGKIESDEEGPTIVFFCGIHGNEPSGIFALNQVFQEIKEKEIPVNGNVYAFAGNMWALKRSERFHKKDLNRLWFGQRMKALEENNFEPENEDEKQQESIFKAFHEVLSQKKGPFYFFDLHTTSSETIPFLTVNDSLLNRKFTKQYPVPLILGIEEYLDGPLLSYINELGYVSFGFEAGSHNDPKSIENHKAFAFLSMVFSGAIDKDRIDYNHYFSMLGGKKGTFYEIYHRHAVNPDDEFVMKPGFVNFQSISKGLHLANVNGAPLYAPDDSKIFMPLYQSQGDDGFFLIRKIPAFLLRLSAYLRILKIDRLLVGLPGIRKSKAEKDSLLVNLKTARLLAKPFLHLLGFRSKTVDKTHLIIRNREINAKTKDYKSESWYVQS